MSLDPVIFDAAAEALGLERWPERGEAVEYRHKGDRDWLTAKVALVWLSLDEVCVDFVNGDHIMPGFGGQMRLGPRPERPDPRPEVKL